MIGGTLTTQEPVITPSVSHDRGFTSTASAERLVMGDAFEADHFNHSMWLDGRMSPIVMVDHFRMYRRTFEEHPHAGISAVTLMFEDSPGQMRSIDSLGKLSQFGQGDLHWTQAGPGVTHNQFPFADAAGEELPIHALQIFVKLPAELEDAAPNSFKVDARDMPHFTKGGVDGRVVVGEFDGYAARGPIPQDLLFLDLWTPGEASTIEVPLPSTWNFLTVPIVGNVLVDQGTFAPAAAAVGAAVAHNVGHGTKARLTLGPASHVVMLAGRPDTRPVYSNGPFAYGSAEGLADAVRRYQRGDFGTCPPMPGQGALWSD